MRLWVLLVLLGGCDALFKINELHPMDAPPGAADVALLTDASSNGPVAWYTFDPIAPVGTTTFADMTGRGNDATCVASECPTSIAGIAGGAVGFDAMSTRLDVKYSTDFAIPNGFTVMGWVMPLIRPNNAFQCPWNKLLGPTNGDTWQLCIDSSFDVIFITDGDELFTSSSVLQLGQWSHIAIRLDGVVKTVLIGGSEVVADGIAMTPASDLGKITFGADLNSGAIDSPFGGYLDDIRIYNRPVSTAEIQQIVLQPTDGR